MFPADRPHAPNPREGPMSHSTRKHVYSLTRDELKEWLHGLGQPAFAAGQVLDWVYRKRVTDWSACSNLSKGLRARMAEEFDILRSTVAARQESGDGTRKLLLEFPPVGDAGRDAKAGRIECVMIPEEDRRTACISTQVGCPAACAFCASGIDGLERNLTAGEIVEQIMRLRMDLGHDLDLTNVVVMGMGEPLANYDNLVKALRILNAPWGGGLGARRFTVSTVGLPSRITQLADEGLQFNLALSLHASTEDIRKRLIPWAKSVDIPELMAACREYFDKTGREVTFEYILLGGVNDRPDHAAELVNLAKPVRANVNLIPYNPVPGLPFTTPAEGDVRRFEDILRRGGVVVHVRRHRGRDIDAACGQLRRKREAEAAAAAEAEAAKAGVMILPMAGA
jgi:23S rRNA (adenine2503-C2)-methyltransferase